MGLVTVSEGLCCDCERERVRTWADSGRHARRSQVGRQMFQVWSLRFLGQQLVMLEQCKISRVLLQRAAADYSCVVLAGNDWSPVGRIGGW